jgi:hypothetical protein
MFLQFSYTGESFYLLTLDHLLLRMCMQIRIFREPPLLKIVCSG